VSSCQRSIRLWLIHDPPPSSSYLSSLCGLRNCRRRSIIWRLAPEWINLGSGYGPVSPLLSKGGWEDVSLPSSLFLLLVSWRSFIRLRTKDKLGPKGPFLSLQRLPNPPFLSYLRFLRIRSKRRVSSSMLCPTTLPFIFYFIKKWKFLVLLVFKRRQKDFWKGGRIMEDLAHSHYYWRALS